MQNDSPDRHCPPNAKIGAHVEIGAYSIIGEHVEIGDSTWIGPHVVINGHTTIGRDNRIFQFASLGEVPAGQKYAGEPTRLEIGDRNTIREFCTFNLGTAQDVGVTRVGNDNWIMAYANIAHDCQVGNNTTLPTTRSWQATCTSMTGRSSAVSPACTSSAVSAHTA